MSAFGTALPPPAPSAALPCPFCRSARVATTSKDVMSEHAYFRCHDCGQIWNPSRLVNRPPQRRW